MPDTSNWDTKGSDECAPKRIFLKKDQFQTHSLRQGVTQQAYVTI